MSTTTWTRERMAPEAGGSSTGNGITKSSNQPKSPGDEPAPSSSSMEYQLKKYLLLLATLVATVTYAAGLNPPGGSWLEDDASAGRLAGDSILRDTNYMRYLVFYCFNAISFAASLVVSLLLLLLHRGDQQRRLLKLTRAVMVVDLLALMGAYAAGGSHDRFTTVCASVLVAAASAYVILVVPNLSTAAAGNNKETPPSSAQPSQSDSAEDGDKEEMEKHEILLLLAIFVATVAYVAGLNPPGGFWRSTQQQQGRHHVAGNPVLQGLHPVRYKFFFFSNTAAFITSLLAITITVHYEKLSDITKRGPPITLIKVALYGLVVTAILGLGGAYAAGSCRDSKHTTYVLCLVVPVLVCIFLQRVLVKSRAFQLPCFGTSPSIVSGSFTCRRSSIRRDSREFIQLLAILAATIAYQAGLDPPGGVWAEGEAPGGGHRVGDPILLTTHPVRYMVFFYFNSGALVASLVIMVILQNEFLVRRHALEAAMILDLFSLMGAYAAGSCRDTSTSIYTVALAGGVLIYVVIHIVFFTLDPSSKTKQDEEEADKKKREDEDNNKLEKKREVLLLVAILAATLTYQAGLTPPGGFWEKDVDGHSAGSPVLQDKYPRRYKAFYYCNAASFMASVALIVLLLNPNLYRPGIKCYALFVCMVAGMFGLIGAYAAGSSLHLRTSIIVLVLVTAVFAVVVYVAYIRRQPTTTTTTTPKEGETTTNHPPAKTNSKEPDMMAKYLMLRDVPDGAEAPGGLWRDDGDGHDAGNPVLYDTEKHRYNAFFYSNSTSFMASVTVIALLLSRMIRDSAKPLWPMHTAMLLDMLALLGAYAAGSARDWGTSKNVVLLLFPVLGFVVLLFFWKKGGDERNKLDDKNDISNGGIDVTVDHVGSIVSNGGIVTQEVGVATTVDISNGGIDVTVDHVGSIVSNGGIVTQEVEVSRYLERLRSRRSTRLGRGRGAATLHGLNGGGIPAGGGDARGWTAAASRQAEAARGAGNSGGVPAGRQRRRAGLALSSRGAGEGGGVPASGGGARGWRWRRRPPGRGAAAAREEARERGAAVLRAWGEISERARERGQSCGADGAAGWGQAQEIGRGHTTGGSGGD
ncbi:hypothetical protein U9M48_001482 [Paspalum notatum var. saurae]|uniref:PGG domain-containing protein n=1 Tax=Paspalum notatum var. saurae TaxID=547442 RepID=A0AAQ3SGR4_PASNO